MKAPRLLWPVLGVCAILLVAAVVVGVINLVQLGGKASSTEARGTEVRVTKIEQVTCGAHTRSAAQEAACVRVCNRLERVSDIHCDFILTRDGGTTAAASSARAPPQTASPGTSSPGSSTPGQRPQSGAQGPQGGTTTPGGDSPGTTTPQQQPTIGDTVNGVANGVADVVQQVGQGTCGVLGGTSCR